MTSGEWCAGAQRSMAESAVGRRLLFVSSSGGVLLDLLALEPFLAHRAPLWAAVHGPDTASALVGREVRWVDEQSPSRPLALMLAVTGAVRALRRDRVGAVVSAGTGVAVPYFLAARLLGIRSVWIETFNLTGGHGIAARVCARTASLVAVQRPEMRRVRRDAVLLGELL